ncbi:hypothetical protein EBQ26_10495 [Allofranklinella schreckenbergeri]|uniref:Uncharacterized protein n=1 Tax=Allofranklinella schreckenbergeri TaxID=1076744 RepID=A0A3M6PYE0_9BURK|nr:hypothetical protein [Allofranklinella schreckenbergeri]RMW96027.1 hypothetical protein EBQ26_10495 [Allofranklinella schreckenbergeri]
MTALLKVLARAGASVGNPFSPARHYIRPRPGDAARDAARIAADMRAVDLDLRRTLGRHLRVTAKKH